MGYVYLIHFDKKLHHAQHYIGFAENDIDERLKTHKKGNGAKILKKLNELNIDYDIVRSWDDVDRKFERKLKNQKKASCLCPICIENKKNIK